MSASVAAALLAGAAWGSTYTVTRAGDSAPTGTLRWAIEQANDHPGADRIVFAAALAGRQIAPLTPLPQVIDDRTTIDGDRDKDGKPDVTLTGKRLTTGSGLFFVGAHWCKVKGLAIVACPQRAIVFYESDYGEVASCHIGVDLAGAKAALNGMDGILLDDSHHCTVGGTTAAKRNVIVGTDNLNHAAVRIVGGQHNTVSGNYIGLSADGMSVLGTGGDGVRVRVFATSAVYNEIGGTEPGARNLFGGVERGVALAYAAHHNTVCGNWFGLRADGSSTAPITGACVDVYDQAGDNLIGGRAAGAANVFAGNAPVGVAVRSQHTHDNKIQGNYFGTNAAGTGQRRLSEGVVISDTAGAQIIGGSTASAGNYFALKDPPEPTVGVRIVAGAGDGTLIRHNKFGIRPDGRSGTAMSRGIDISGAGAQVLDNLFAGTDQGILAKNTDASLRIFRNTFRGCGTGVNIDPGACCLLGNLGNPSTEDDGGNIFRLTNTWHIRNFSALGIRAEGCHFGTKSKAAINQKIWDRRDNPFLGRVDFIPLKGGIIPSGSTVAVTGVVALPTRGAGAQITFTLSSTAQVEARVLNIAGRPVATICRARDCDAGTNTLVWDARSDQGLPVPNGTYLIEVAAKAEDGAQARALGEVSMAR